MPNFRQGWMIATSLLADLNSMSSLVGPRGAGLDLEDWWHRGRHLEVWMS